MKYDLQTNKGLVSFQHIRDFYEDKKLLLRCARKLTDAHMTSTGLNSMKVSLAAQVFSHSVAAGMSMCILANFIQASSSPAVEFIMHINHIFDSLNGTSKNPQRGNEYRCAIKEGSIHLNF